MRVGLVMKTEVSLVLGLIDRLTQGAQQHSLDHMGVIPVGNLRQQLLVMNRGGGCPAAEIQSSIDTAPARIVLPEIKLTPAAESSSKPDAEPSAQPTIELVREENRVQQIILNCSCGQSIRMDCDY